MTTATICWVRSTSPPRLNSQHALRNGIGVCKLVSMLQVRRWRNESLSRFFETELRAWYGLEPLWKVFWGYGVLASTVIAALYALAVLQRRGIVQELLLVFFAGYTLWIIVSVWRCARSSAPIWQTLARSLTVAWAANAALVVGFLQLDLIARLFVN